MVQDRRYDALILGAGLAGLATALRLHELGMKRIALIAKGYGGTPYIAALNGVLLPNTFGDSHDQHYEDMLQAGYGINDKAIVRRMADASTRSVEFLQQNGVVFAEENGTLKRRHASGSKYPRSLCRTDMLVGEEVVQKLEKKLREAGAAFIPAVVTRLLVEDGAIYGVTVYDGEQAENVYAPVVVAAWGGTGKLFGDSTYPDDVDGRGLAMAYEAGASLVDLEFLEFEPMVVLYPEEAKGEPCPTAMLGEGAYLRNTEGERFLLRIRPQGEGGTPKTVINKAIWEEVRNGKGTEYGGVYADLRHIPVETLKAYPWFYNRVTNAGHDLTTQLLNVGAGLPQLLRRRSCARDVRIQREGFLRRGRSHGRHARRVPARRKRGMRRHGVGGTLCGEHHVLSDHPTSASAAEASLPVDLSVRDQYLPEIKRILSSAMGSQRDGATLQKAVDELTALQDKTKPDFFTAQSNCAGLLMLHTALTRTESRGTHLRTDYPETSADWQASIEVYAGADGEIAHTVISRK